MIVMFRDPFFVTYGVTHAYPTKIAWNTCYGELLEPWLEVFPRRQFLFLTSESFFQNPQHTLDKVFKFAGARKFKLPHDEMYASGRRRNPARRRWNELAYQEFHGSARALECRSLL